MITLAQFRLKFPAFRQVPDPQIEQAITEADAELDAKVWGTTKDAGVHFLTAHKLSLSPGSPGARIDTKEGGKQTTYYDHFVSMRNQVTGGFRVI